MLDQALASYQKLRDCYVELESVLSAAACDWSAVEACLAESDSCVEDLAHYQRDDWSSSEAAQLQEHAAACAAFHQRIAQLMQRQQTLLRDDGQQQQRAGKALRAYQGQVQVEPRYQDKHL